MKPVISARPSTAGDFTEIKANPYSVAKREAESKKKQMCQWMIRTGECRYGNRCYYSHEGIPVREPVRDKAPVRGGYRGRGMPISARGGRTDVYSTGRGGMVSHFTPVVDEVEKFVRIYKKPKAKVIIDVSNLNVQV